MNNCCSTIIQIADVNIQFTSDLDVDILQLNNIFKYHIVKGYSNIINHTVIIKGVKNDVVPESANIVWKGSYHGIDKMQRNSPITKLLDSSNGTEYYRDEYGRTLINESNDNISYITLKDRQNPFRKGYIRLPLGSFLTLVLQVIMAKHKRYAIHASAILFNQKAVIFPGHSGTGKTTLCVDLVKKGAGFMGDDIIFLYEDTDQICVASLLLYAQIKGNKKKKDKVDIIRTYNAQIIKKAPLRAVCCIYQTQKGQSYVEPATNGMNMFDVILQSVNSVAIIDDCNDWLNCLNNICEKIKLYNFFFGERKLLNINILDALIEND